MLKNWVVISFLAFYGTRLAAQTPGTLATAQPPAYPLAAKAAGVEGKVKLKGIIGTDGKLRDVQVVKGPPELHQAAVDAVARWTYHPYLDRGVPVDLPITIVVNFTMGDKKHKAAEQAAAQAELAKEAAAQGAH